ncbi:MAG: acetoacetate--CoA ligase, partial [Solirubrobacteraceae bacterium]|nr:acetoacetate--CoA ligase [Solirubrobacteraceae bacterium]
MRAAADDSPLWTPSDEQIEGAQITAFGRAVGHGGSYEELWRWSVEEPAAFWGAIWDRYGVGEPQGEVLTWRSVADATWFPNARVNYARHLFA